MAETAKTMKSDEKSTLGAGSSNFLKKSALSQTAANKWSAATSAFSATPIAKPAALVSFDLSGGKKSTVAEKADGNQPKIDAPSGFVFGSKLSSRVSNAATSDADSGPKDVSSIFKQVAGSGSSGLFLSGKSEDGEVKSFAETNKSTTEDEKQKNAAAAGPDLVETFTGEEDEKNLLHLSCKFFFFDVSTKNWQERGLGTLRINENIETPHSYRIIGRATGNQRVCINTNVFPEMVVEKMTEKRLKISAINPDSETPQLFVIQASPASIQGLHRMLEDLLPKVKNAATRKRRLEGNSADDSEIPPKNPPVDRTAKTKKEEEEKRVANKSGEKLNESKVEEEDDTQEGSLDKDDDEEEEQSGEQSESQ